MAREEHEGAVSFERPTLSREAVVLGRPGGFPRAINPQEPLAGGELLGSHHGSSFSLVVVPARDQFNFPAVPLVRAFDVRLTGPIPCGAIQQSGPSDEAMHKLFAVEHRKRDAFEKPELGVARWIGNKGHYEISSRQSLDFGGFYQCSQGGWTVQPPAKSTLFPMQQTAVMWCVQMTQMLWLPRGCKRCRTPARY